MDKHSIKHIARFLILAVFVFPGIHATPVHADAKQERKDMKLLTSLKKGKFRKFEQLLKKGANPNRIFGKQVDDWVMCEATRKGNMKFLKLAVMHGGDINLRNPYTNKSVVKAIFSAPLLCSIRLHNVESFSYLLDKGVNIDIKACTDCKHERHHGSAVTVAESGNEYKMAMKLISLRETQLSKFEIDKLIHGIEKTTIDIDSDENIWRLKMVDWLTSQGHQITPWKPTDECRRKNCE